MTLAMPSSPKPDAREPRRGSVFLWAALAMPILVVSAVVAGGLTLYAKDWGSHEQASGSMIPTLLVGDRFFMM